MAEEVPYNNGKNVGNFEPICGHDDGHPSGYGVKKLVRIHHIYRTGIDNYFGATGTYSSGKQATVYS